MRPIAKRSEPSSLTLHRCTAHANYDNFLAKDVLRTQLVAEQRGLCCYCMSRIVADPERMKIEHWHCQENYPREELDYGNLLGSCLGGQGQPLEQQTCDSRKGMRELSRNPADPNLPVDRDMHYDGSGRIRSDDSQWDSEINDVLNLNKRFLMNNRKGALDAFTQGLNRRGQLSRSTIERMLREWNGEDGRTRLEPFSHVVVYWLRKRLAQA